jgi:hypothetical protein
MKRLTPDDEAFLAKARVTMKKCQVGTNRLDHAHDILADCYGMIGRLIRMAEEGQSDSSVRRERAGNAA